MGKFGGFGLWENERVRVLRATEHTPYFGGYQIGQYFIRELGTQKVWRGLDPLMAQCVLNHLLTSGGNDAAE